MLDIAHSRSVTLSFKFLAWPGTVIYAIKIYTSAKILISQELAASLGATLVVITSIQFVLLIIASILEAIK